MILQKESLTPLLQFSILWHFLPDKNTWPKKLLYHVNNVNTNYLGPIFKSMSLFKKFEAENEDL